MNYLKKFIEIYHSKNQKVIGYEYELIIEVFIQQYIKLYIELI